MTYQEALQYLNSFIDYEKRDGYGYAGSFKLDRMRKLCRALGDPQKSVRSIHVAGTKGKGSTAVMIQSILKSAGYRAGLYTSPHLVSFRERIRIGDEMIGEDGVSSILGVIKKALAGMGDDRPTYFEIYTALAFLYYKKERADITVFETGLGGRLDATNVIEPLVSAITPISYDHTHVLGRTLEEIAGEKAGIIKDGCACVSAPQAPGALRVIEKACKERAAQLILVGRDIVFKELSASDEETVFDLTGLFGKYAGLRMKLLGQHQMVNAAVAVGVVEALRFDGMQVGPDAIKRGIESARWPGRLEVARRRSPRILLDGAQNRASADELARAVKRLFKYKKLILVLGVSKDKDIKGILKELVPIADSIILTRSGVAGRAMDPSNIKDMITPKSKDVTVTQDTVQAMDKAMLKAGASDLILVTGSLFVVGEVRGTLVKDGQAR